MDAFGIMGMTFGIMGFIFGISALGQVNALKKELNDLKQKMEKNP